MTVAIRQEINLINRIIEGDGGDGIRDIEIVHIEDSEFNGGTWYFEIVVKNIGSGICTIYSRSDDNPAFSSGVSDSTTISVPANTNEWTIMRSGDLGLMTENYFSFRINDLSSNAGDLLLKSFKYIILQSATDITHTQTQIEIGQYGLIVPADNGIKYVIPEPKYWKYESAKWDPTPTFKFAFTMGIEDDKETYLIGLQEASDAAFTSNLLYISDTEVTVNTEVATYYESAAFTPKDGYFYRIQYESDDDKGDEIYLFNAKVIATQPFLYDSYELFDSADLLDDDVFYTSQSFSSDVTDYLVMVEFQLWKGGSPTGNVYAKLYAHTGVYGTSSEPTGSALATSEPFDVSTLTTTAQSIRFNFLSPYQLTGSATKYCIVLEYSNGTASNYVLYDYQSSGSHGGNYAFYRDDEWNVSSNIDLTFKIFTGNSDGAITKLQPEYLMINEAQTGTGLPLFLIDWDPAEWEGVDNNYYHEHSADSSSSNTKLVENNQLLIDNLVVPQLSAAVYGGSGLSEEAALTFTTPNDSISYQINYFGIDYYCPSQPSDNYQTRLTTSIGGSAIATTEAINGSDISVGYSTIYFKFSSAQILTPNTKYFLEFYRSGSRDQTNYMSIRYAQTADIISGAGYLDKDWGSWGSENSNDPCLLIPGFLDIANSDITGDDLIRSNLDDYYQIENGTIREVYSSQSAAGQSFTSQGGIVKKVIFDLRKYGSPTGNCYCKIYAHSGTYGSNSVATGSALVISDAIDVSAIPTSQSSITFKFSTEYTLIASTYYVVLFEFTGGDINNLVYLYLDNSTRTHSGNYISYVDPTYYPNSSIEAKFFVFTDKGLTMPATAKEIDSYIVTA